MAVQWTKEQQQVISLRDRNILVSAAAGRTKHGAGRGQWLTWLCCPALAALFLCARMRKKAVLLKPDPYLPARFLCDLFILYQKDGKKREAVLLTM